MAGIREGNYNFSQLETAKAPNISEIQAQVGRQLNEQYYNNRQAFVTNVSNPINNMKVSERDRPLFNSIRDKITEQGNAFRDSNDWSQATNYVFNATEDILTNQALKSMQESYALEAQYNDDLKKSGWDSRMQSAFKLRSQLQSEAIQYDADSNTVLGGGFNGVQVGNPIDITKKYKQITDTIGKIKASGTEVTSVSATDALVQGLANVVNMDGETFVSNFLSSTYATEGVSYDTIANYARSVLQNDPEFTSYFETVAINEGFLKRYNPQTGQVDNWRPEHLADIYKDSYTLVSLAGHGLPFSDIGVLKNDGSFELNPNMSEETQTALDLASTALGFSFRDLLQGNNITLNTEQNAALQDYLNQGYINYINGNLNDYLSGIGVKNVEDAVPYIDQWYQQQLTQDKINTTINEFSDTTGKLMSYQKTKTIQSVVSNQTPFAAAWKAKQKKKEEMLAAGAPTFASMPDKVATTETTRELLERRRELGDTLAKVKIDNQGIVFTESDLQTLGLGNDINALETFNLDNWLTANPNVADSVSQPIVDKVRQYQRNANLINAIQTELSFDESNIQRSFDIYNNDNRIKQAINNKSNFGNDPVIKGILELGLSSYDEYQVYLANNGNDKRLFVEGNSGATIYGSSGGFSRPLTEQEFNTALTNSIDAVRSLYNSNNPNNPLTYATKADVVFNPSPSTTQFMNTGIASIASLSGDWTLESVSTGKISNVALNDPELTAPFTTQVQSKSENAKGTKAKKLGIDSEIFSVDYNPVFDPSGINVDGTRKFKMQAVFKGKNGEVLGDAIVSRNITPQTYNQLIQDNYTQAYRYDAENPQLIGDGIYAEARGKAAVQSTQSNFEFRAVNGEASTTAAANVNSLQQRLNNQAVGSVVYTEMPLSYPINGLPTGTNIKLEITKVGIDNAGTPGYKVRAVEKVNGRYLDASRINFGNGYKVDFQTLSDEGQPVQQISDALVPLSNTLLEIGSLIQIQNSKK